MVRDPTALALLGRHQVLAVEMDQQTANGRDKKAHPSSCSMLTTS